MGKSPEQEAILALEQKLRTSEVFQKFYKGKLEKEREAKYISEVDGLYFFNEVVREFNELHSESTWLSKRKRKTFNDFLQGAYVAILVLHNENIEISQDFLKDVQAKFEAYKSGVKDVSAALEKSIMQKS